MPHRPPRKQHPRPPRRLTPPDVSWKRRQWRQYLDNTIDAMAEHLTPPILPTSPTTTTPPDSPSTSLRRANLPPLQPTLPKVPAPGRLPVPQRPAVSQLPTPTPIQPPAPIDDRAETIARLTPNPSLFDRSIADRRRQRHAQTAQAAQASQIPPVRPTQSPRSLHRRSEPVRRSRSNTVTPLHRPSASVRTPERSRRDTPLNPVLYGVRLVVLGVGLSAIAGTLLSILLPVAPESASRDTDTMQAQAQPVALQRTQAIASLTGQIQALAARYPEFVVGVSIVDVDTGAFVDLNGDRVLAAASTVKLPILVAFFQAVDRGEVRLDETLILQREQVAGGSGKFQFDAPGTEYSALEVMTQTIVTSDNTATNMIIDRLGGAAALNAQFQGWGLVDTALNAPLPDLDGTNTTSPDDLTHLLSSIDRGELVSLRSRDRLLDILEATANDRLLAQVLGTGATIAHKTGNIRHSLSDSGLIDLPNGKRYVLSAIVKRPAEDDRAAEIIRDVSQLAHDYFSGTADFVSPSGNPNGNPSGNPELPATQQAQRPLDRPAP